MRSCLCLSTQKSLFSFAKDLFPRSFRNVHTDARLFVENTRIGQSADSLYRSRRVDGIQFGNLRGRDDKVIGLTNACEDDEQS